MWVNLRLPPQPKGTANEQFAKLRSYLYQTVNDLNFNNTCISQSFDDLRKRITDVSKETMKAIEEKIRERTDGLADYITERGYENGWEYRKYKSGMTELFLLAKIPGGNTSGSINYPSNIQLIARETTPRFLLSAIIQRDTVSGVPLDLGLNPQAWERRFDYNINTAQQHDVYIKAHIVGHK